MLKMRDGRERFFQWDVGQSLDVEGDVTEVHIGLRGWRREGYHVVEPIEGIVAVYDELLQVGDDVVAYEYKCNGEEGHTEAKYVFGVDQRPKPEHYAYTPTKSYSWEYWCERAKMYAEMAEESVRDIPDLMTAWWESHKDDFKGKDGDDGYTPRKGIDYFDGVDGYSPIAKVTPNENGAIITVTDKNGTTIAEIENGTDGTTPIRGVDYFTQADKSELVEEVKEQVPPYDDTEIKSELTDVKESLNQKADKSDLDNKVGFGDVATASKVGLTKPSVYYGTSVGVDGTLTGFDASLNYYKNSAPRQHIISKGTLENVLAERLKEPTWELVDDFTISEPTTYIERRADKYGNPYNFKRLKIVYDLANGVGSYIMHKVFAHSLQGVATAMWVGETINTQEFAVAYIEHLNGSFEFKGSSATNTTTSSNISSTYYTVAQNDVVFSPIEGIAMQRHASYPFVVGTKIKIYGIRA